MYKVGIFLVAICAATAITPSARRLEPKSHSLNPQGNTALAFQLAALGTKIMTLQDATTQGFNNLTAANARVQTEQANIKPFIIKTLLAASVPLLIKFGKATIEFLVPNQQQELVSLQNLGSVQNTI